MINIRVLLSYATAADNELQRLETKFLKSLTQAHTQGGI